MSTMTEAGQNLLDQALRLSADERAVLAASLWASLETDSAPEIEAAWAEEIRRRLERIESGEDQPVPWEELRGRLRARFSR
jgi:putative addiction module component (TIGR02574 family)